MKPLIQTRRLLLRHFEDKDAMQLFALNADKQVLQYTGDIPFKKEEDALAFIKNYTAYDHTGIGRYAVIRKQDQQFLGWCGLKYHAKERKVDIGFRFFREYWNQGYATESAQAVIDYAFNTLNYPLLIARAHVLNIASHRVLKKCQMLPIQEFDNDGLPSIVYHLYNPDYLIKEITAEQTWPVRHPVLRKGRPLKDVYMEADEKESTFHLGAYHKNKIVGVASFMEDANPIFTGVQSRLRGMAVLPAYRKKGIAERMLHKGEDMLKERGRTLLWFNARIVALSFYKTLGYQTVGKEFDIPRVGPHYVMKKQLI